jgi:hypothetical protein
MPPTLLGLEPEPSFKRKYERVVNAKRIDRILETVEVKLRSKAEQGWRHAAKPLNVEVAKRPNMISTH